MQLPSVEHFAGHDWPAPSHRYGAQLGEPAAPATASVHEPAMTPEQVWHAPEQLEPQHTFDTQKPLEHCRAVEHAAPAVSCGVQVPELQK